MKNDTTFVRMRSGDHLETQNVEKGHLAPSNLTYTQTHWVVCHPCSHKHAIDAHSHNSHYR